MALVRVETTMVDTSVASWIRTDCVTWAVRFGPRYADVTVVTFLSALIGPPVEPEVA